MRRPSRRSRAQRRRPDVATIAGGLLLVVLVAACGSAPEAETPEAPPDAEWVQLFDGESLDGWTPKVTGFAPGENPGRTFRVGACGGPRARGFAHRPFRERRARAIVHRSADRGRHGGARRFVGEAEWAAADRGSHRAPERKPPHSAPHGGGPPPRPWRDDGSLTWDRSHDGGTRTQES